MQVVDAELLHKPIGLSFRRSALGPEQELIEWFLGQPLKIPAGYRATVFREPRLPSGFPDLVIVIWKEAVTRAWTPSRAALTTSDLRLMQLLAATGPHTECELESKFSTSMVKNLVRLVEASMIRKSRRRWQNRCLSTVFATTHIIAVEAKIKDWRQALEQAHLNTWFASQSCILIPKIPRYSTLLQDARELGVSVLTQQPAGWELTPTKRQKPRSYVSWLFNDWAWKAAMQQGV